jgi:hypothetical protein
LWSDEFHIDEFQGDKWGNELQIDESQGDKSWGNELLNDELLGDELPRHGTVFMACCHCFTRRLCWTFLCVM